MNFSRHAGYLYLKSILILGNFIIVKVGLLPLCIYMQVGLSIDNLIAVKDDKFGKHTS